VTGAGAALSNLVAGAIVVAAGYDAAFVFLVPSRRSASCCICSRCRKRPAPESAPKMWHPVLDTV
jgi:hypothetical protein